MKKKEALGAALVLAMLAGCSTVSAPSGAGKESALVAAPEEPVERADSPDQPTTGGESEATSITEVQALIGVWHGLSGGGWLLIDGDLQTTLAQTLADLEGESINPTMYQGSIRIDGDSILFEDQRCEEEGPGRYQVVQDASDGLSFIPLSDNCSVRVNNLVGQRHEPRIDIVWSKQMNELPGSEKTQHLQLVRTIELPFVPHDIAVGADGDLYVVELSDARVHRLTSDGEILNTWGSAGDQAGEFAFSPPPGGPPLQGGFIEVGPSGVVYVTDSYNNRVQLFDREGDFLTMWTRYGAEDTPFNSPGPISVDSSGNVYVTDFSGLHVLDADGNHIRSLQAGGEVAFDSDDNLYATVAFENIAMVLPAAGGEPLIWGGQGMEDGQFETPIWLVVGPDGTVYIADHSGRVQMFDGEGHFTGVWTGPSDSKLTAAAALALDADGELFVAPKDRTSIYILSLLD